MCGMFGAMGEVGGDQRAALVERMGRAMAHRGPDGDGVWAAPDAPLALGHRRLAIIDLSPTGAQPMASAGGRFVMTYNGEIYNYRELRAELEAAGAAPVWRGSSDTEVVLAAFERWGVAATLPKLEGMFALAVWDRHERALLLARDRAGEKPLHVLRGPRRLAFASEPRALREVAGDAWRLDGARLAGFMRYGFVPGGGTLIEGIEQIGPGTLSTVRLCADGTLATSTAVWWQPATVYAEARAAGASRQRSDGELLEELDALLRRAVRLRLAGDVPVGAFLSGGIDSSLVVAYMQQASSRPAHTFSIGFDDPRFDESAGSRLAANTLGTEHTQLRLSLDGAMRIVPMLASTFDAPLGDPSQIPTLLVSAVARRSVTVALSGDAGDELFGGYDRYALATRARRGIERVPRPLRGALAGAIGGERRARAGAALLNRVLPRRGLGGEVRASRLRRFARALRADDARGFYSALVAQHEGAERLLVGAPTGELPNPALWAPEHDSALAQMMMCDFTQYLPDDILAKVDRAAMAVSLETRVPLLDDAVMRFAWSLPDDARMRDGRGKWLLRALLRRFVPETISAGPKRGFGAPVGEWLRGGLRGWAEELLGPARLRAQGLFDPQAVQALWTAHRDQQADHEAVLWSLLAFQSWHDAWLEAPPTSTSLAASDQLAARVVAGATPC